MALLRLHPEAIGHGIWHRAAQLTPGVQGFSVSVESDGGHSIQIRTSILLNYSSIIYQYYL